MRHYLIVLCVIVGLAIFADEAAPTLGAARSTFIGWGENCPGMSPCIRTTEGGKSIAPVVAAGTLPLPRLVVSKSASLTAAQVGETITYTYQVTNTGNVTLGVEAVDDQLGPVSLRLSPGGTLLFPVQTLQPGQTALGTHSYTVQVRDLPGPLTNTVVVTGTSATAVITATAQASVVLLAPPTVVITSPTPNQRVQVGQPVVITVEVASPAIIVKVVFFANNKLLPGCIDTSSPFQCTWTPTAAGPYNLTAVAVDDLGSVSTSLPVTVIAEAGGTGPSPLYLPLIRNR
jgi:uncharacterized repeat protein (TIGR01451 family)